MTTTTMSGPDEDLVRKAKKILALTKSPNRHEAEAAMGKLTELMTAHQLTVQDLQAAEASPYDHQVKREGKRLPVELKFITLLLDGYFFVRIVFSTDTEGYKRIHILGRPHHAEVAIHVYEFLKATYRRLWDESRKAYGWDVTSRRSFYKGLTAGIHERLKAERRRVEQTMALVVVEDPRLEEHVEEAFPKAKSVDYGRDTRKDVTAYRVGVYQGGRVNITQGISAGTTAGQIGGR